MLIFLRRCKKLYIVRSPVVQSRFALLISCNDSLTKVVWPLQQGVKNKTDLVRRAAVFYRLQPIRARKLGLQSSGLPLCRTFLSTPGLYGEFRQLPLQQKRDKDT